MAKVIKVCDICGKKYEYCKTWNIIDAFRWQDVACSEECGAEFFKRVMEARKQPTVEEIKEENTEEVVVELDIIDVDDEEDDEDAEVYEYDEP